MICWLIFWEARPRNLHLCIRQMMLSKVTCSSNRAARAEHQERVVKTAVGSFLLMDIMDNSDPSMGTFRLLKT